MKFHNFSSPAIEHIVLTETRQHHFSWWQKWNASFYLNNELNVSQRHHIPSFAIFTSFLVLQSLLFVNLNSSLCQLIGHLFDDVSFFSYSLLVNFHKRAGVYISIRKWKLFCNKSLNVVSFPKSFQFVKKSLLMSLWR